MRSKGLRHFGSSVALAAALGLGMTAVADAHCGSCEHDKMKQASAKAQMDIVDTAVAAGDFNTLVAAVKAAGLVDALKSDGPFTVFAPNDAAFAKLPKSAIEDLLKPENKGKLSNILTYHVVSGRVPSEQALKLKSASALNGLRGGSWRASTRSAATSRRTSPTSGRR